MSESPPRLSLGGHARVGWASRKGPDLLAVHADRLILHCLRPHSFTPDQVVAIQRRGPIWLDAGVRIVHTQEDCPRLVTFACSGGSDEVFRLLACAGFVPRGRVPAGTSSLLSAARLLLAVFVAYVIVAEFAALLHLLIQAQAGLPT